MTERTAFRISEWCQRNGISRGHFYKLQKQGLAPRVFHLGDCPLISIEADAAWRRARNAEADGEAR